jgi:hypothetical protein
MLGRMTVSRFGSFDRSSTFRDHRWNYHRRLDVAGILADTLYARSDLGCDP